MVVEDSSNGSVIRIRRRREFSTSDEDEDGDEDEDQKEEENQQPEEEQKGLETLKPILNQFRTTLLNFLCLILEKEF